jgi:hypothetical protein
LSHLNEFLELITNYDAIIIYFLKGKGCADVSKGSAPTGGPHSSAAQGARTRWTRSTAAEAAPWTRTTEVVHGTDGLDRPKADPTATGGAAGARHGSKPAGQMTARGGAATRGDGRRQRGEERRDAHQGRRRRDYNGEAGGGLLGEATVVRRRTTGARRRTVTGTTGARRGRFQ